MPIKKSYAGQNRPRPELPHPDMALAAIIETYPLETFETRRPPDVAGRTLAFIIELEKTGQAFPLRLHAAEWLGCSQYGIDAALSQALRRGLLTSRMSFGPNRPVTSTREGVLRYRHYVPTKKLLDGIGRVRKVAAKAGPKIAA